MEFVQSLWDEFRGDTDAFVGVMQGTTTVTSDEVQVSMVEPVGRTVGRLALYCALMSIVLIVLDHIVVPLLCQLAEFDDKGRAKLRASLRELVFYGYTTITTWWVYWDVDRVWYAGEAPYADMLSPLGVTGIQAMVRGPRMIRVTYFTELSFYVTGIILLFMDPKRKDFFVMFAHHLVTCSLLLLSWSCGWLFAGVAVLLVHNFSDMCLHFAKIMNYYKLELISNAVFVVFISSWAYLRLWGYLHLIHRTACAETWEFITTNSDFGAAGCVALLIALYPMHVYWFYLIVQVLFMMFAGKSTRDVREDSDSDTSGKASQDGDKAKKE